ncbi:MAG: sigma-70 family RNA polymerase sigma factor [Anaerolineaceae bacterium]|nr:sigma-70 family RNA polymerase sigma factor [Anaerolineaceae bacterium]
MRTQTDNNSNQLDRNRLRTLYEENNAGMYRYAYRLLGNRELAEECVSETFTKFLQVVQRRKKLDGNLKAYLYRMAHNWIVDYYRKEKPEEPFLDHNLSDPGEHTEHHILAKQQQEKLRKALMKLPEEQRMVIALRFLEDWSHDRVAEFLGKSIESTRALQYRALVKLRKRFS